MLRMDVRQSVLVSLTLIAILLRPGEVLCAWPDDPETNLPICTAEGIQEHPRIVTDGAAGAIIVWQDTNPLSTDVYAQRVDARGLIRWTRDGVAICLEKDNQWFPNLVSDGFGGAIIAWWDERNGNTDLYTQRINGDGEVQWQPGGIPVCIVPKDQVEFNMTPDGEGGAIIAWHDYRADSGTPYVYAQRVSADSRVLWNQDGVLVAGEEGYQKYPALADDGFGGAIIAWQDWRDGRGDIYMQRVNPDGQVLWGEYGMPLCKLPERQWHPAVVSDGEGGVIVVWMDHRNDEETEIISRSDGQREAGWDIYAQRVNAQGEVRWHENGVPVCLARGDQYDYSVLSDDASGVFITWHDQREGNWDIYAQKLNASGDVKWEENGLPICTEPGDQYNPNIASDGVGGIIITWWDRRDGLSDIYAQRIDAAGEFLWVESGTAISTAEGSQQDSYAVNSGAGSAIITWWDKRKVEPDIYAQRVFSE